MGQTVEGGERESKRQDPREQGSDYTRPLRAWKKFMFFF